MIFTLADENNGMNIIVKYFTLFPTFTKYLKGGMLFHKGKYSSALNKFDTCIKHPSFQHELTYSYYGQTLCALGRLGEGHKFLIKACREFEKDGWAFESDYSQNLAQNTFNALRKEKA